MKEVALPGSEFKWAELQERCLYSLSIAPGTDYQSFSGLQQHQCICYSLEVRRLKWVPRPRFFWRHQEEHLLPRLLQLAETTHVPWLVAPFLHSSLLVLLSHLLLFIVSSYFSSNEDPCGDI